MIVKVFICFLCALCFLGASSGLVNVSAKDRAKHQLREGSAEKKDAKTFTKSGALNSVKQIKQKEPGAKNKSKELDETRERNY